MSRTRTGAGVAVAAVAVAVAGVLVLAQDGVPLIPAGATWRYLDNGSNQGSNWVSAAFSDAAWSNGAAELGYGDGGEATVLRRLGVTFYFRRFFQATNAAAYTRLRLGMLYDDGIIVYLNGVEVARRNLTGGPVASDTRALSEVPDGPGETAFRETNVNVSLLLEGTNLLAAELHRASGSTDISFNAYLVATNPVFRALSVESPWGRCSPPAGTHLFEDGEWVTGVVTGSPVADGVTQYVCRGWTATGSLTNGVGTNTGPFRITNDTAVIWQWDTNLSVLLTVSSPHGRAVPPVGVNTCVLDSVQVCAVTGSPFVVASTQYVCAGWLGSGSLTNGLGTNTGPFRITNDTSIAWLWDAHAPVSFSVTSEYGRCRPSTGTYTYVYDTPVVCTVTGPPPWAAGTQYVCRGWVGTGSLTNGLGTNTGPFRITNDSSVTWTWGVATPRLTIVSDPDLCWPPSGVYTCTFNAEVSCVVTASPRAADGTQQVCLGWSGSGSVGGGLGTNTPVFRISNDTTVAWRWRTNVWVGAGADGAGSVLFANRWYPRGTSAVVQAVAFQSCRFAGWFGETQGVDVSQARLAFTADAPRQLVARFELRPDPGGQTPPPEVEFPTPSFVDRFRLVSSNLNLAGPWRQNVSGCALRPLQDDLLVIINNTSMEIPTVQVYGRDGAYKTNLTMTGFSDGESIAAYPPGGDRFAVLEEGLAVITLVTIDGVMTNIAKSDGIPLSMNLGPPFGLYFNNGMEGVTYDDGNGVFYTVKERVPMGVYAVLTNGTGVVVAATLFDAEAVFTNRATDLSDLRYDAPSGRLLILSDESNSVFECDLDGTIRARASLFAGPPHQPEGLVLTEDRRTLLVVGEPNYLLRYDLQPPSTTCVEGAVVDLPVRLSWPWTNAVTVDVSITSGTAVAGVDYAPATGRIVFAAGETSACLRIEILRDVGSESQEVLRATLSPPVGGVLGRDRDFDVVIPGHTVLVFTVSSPYGDPSPTSGTYGVEYGTGVEGVLSNAVVDLGPGTQAVCVGWTGSGSIPSGEGLRTPRVPLTNNSALTWVWQTRYWLSVLTNGPGTVSGGNAWIADGTNATLEAAANPHCRFAGWSGDIEGGETNGAVLDLPMVRPRSVEGAFALTLALYDTPEWWLALHYPATNDFDAAALSDTDGDGHPAWAEYRAGTDPTNAASVLRITETRAEPDAGFRLWWTSATGRFYEVLAATGLSAWGSSESLTNRVPAEAGGTNEFLDSPGSEAARYYRIRLE